MGYPKNFGPLNYNGENKKRFLNASAHLMRTVAKNLQMQGLIGHFEVRKNEGGIAVSGEVYATFYLRDMKNAIQLELSETCMAPGIFGATSRPDRIICMGQYRQADGHGRVKHGVEHPSRIVGDNQYLRGEINVDAVYDLAVRMLNDHPSLKVPA